MIGETLARQHLSRQLSHEEAMRRTGQFSARKGHMARARAFAGLEPRPDEWGDAPVFASLRRPSSFCVGYLPTITQDARIAVSFSDGTVWLVSVEMLEIAQGLPVGWTAGMSEKARDGALGDALAVPVAEAWGRWALALIGN